MYDTHLGDGVRKYAPKGITPFVESEYILGQPCRKPAPGLDRA